MNNTVRSAVTEYTHSSRPVRDATMWQFDKISQILYQSELLLLISFLHREVSKIQNAV